jgi:glycosyltransferase involved in cell wall biosynthesis
VAGPVVVVIPAFQAAATIRDVVSRARAAVPEARVVVVNDGSTDGSYAALADRVLIHERNLGKGAALRHGIEEAIRLGAAIIVTLDADGQHRPEEIPRLVQPVLTGRADLVLGARSRNDAMPASRRMTNWLSATLATRIGGQRVPDAQTGFRAFSRDVAVRVRPHGDRYEYEANFLLDALRAGFRMTSIEVPTIYGVRSHFRPWSDTWRMVRAFARHAGRIVAGAA